MSAREEEGRGRNRVSSCPLPVLLVLVRSYSVVFGVPSSISQSTILLAWALPLCFNCHVDVLEATVGACDSTGETSAKQGFHTGGEESESSGSHCGSHCGSGREKQVWRGRLRSLLFGRIAWGRIIQLVASNAV